MQSFKIALINEIERMLKRKKAVVISILTFLIVAIYQIIILFFNKSFNIQVTSASNFSFLTLDFMIVFILPLFTTLVVIDAFASEYNNNTIKISLLKPVLRIKLFIAKVLACLCFVAFSLSLLLVFSMISGLIFSSRSVSVLDILSALSAYTLTLVPFAVLILAIAMMCHFMKSPAGVFFTCAIIYIGIGVTAWFVPVFRNIFFTSNMSWYSILLLPKYHFKER